MIPQSQEPTMPLAKTVIPAKDFLHPSAIVIDSAKLLATAVSASLGHSEEVSICMAGLPAVSGNYFNVVLLVVLDECGLDAIDRVHLTSASSFLTQIFERSREAARRLGLMR
jgi:hypothetical protein